MTKISGISFIKDGISLGYPVIESIQSIEPLCDEIIINVGFNNPECTKDDGTEQLLKDTLTGSKYKFVRSHWDPQVCSGGEILSQQTNIALKEATGDICQYIQADEAVHEEDFPEIEKGFKDLVDNKHIHGLIYNYMHFYGSVNVYKYSRSVYRREVRTIKNNIDIISWKDAQGFRFANKSKINAKQTKARIFHYGWAREQEIMKRKIKKMDALYHGDNIPNNEFEYSKLWGIKEFQGTHPAVLDQWIKNNASDIDILSMANDYRFKNWSLMVADFIERLTGHRLGEYKNFKQVR